MSASEHMADFLSMLQQSLLEGSFVKLSLTGYQGSEPIKSIEARRIIVKRQEKLSFTTHYKTRDEVKNYAFAESMVMLPPMLENDFKTASLFTTQADLRLEKKASGFTLKQMAASQTQAPSLSHDQQKKRLIDPSRHYLMALKISDAKGNVFKNAQDKFRQIDKYVEVLSGLIKTLPKQDVLRVVDMGAGKGYLTFALYDYLMSNGIQAEVTGVEYRADMVELCNHIAKESGFTGLTFVQGTIEDYDCGGAHVVIALHACDTATDDALFKAISAKAELVVVAPCCHKQIRREMEKTKATNPLDFLTRFGTLMERQAEMVTDGMRAQLLEVAGYKTNLFEFISDAHTPKNVMIVGTKDARGLKCDDIAASIAAEKKFFGIGHHHLERLMGIA